MLIIRYERNIVRWIYSGLFGKMIERIIFDRFEKFVGQGSSCRKLPIALPFAYLWLNYLKWIVGETIMIGECEPVYVFINRFIRVYWRFALDVRHRMDKFKTLLPLKSIRTTVWSHFPYYSYFIRNETNTRHALVSILFYTSKNLLSMNFKI